MYLCICNFVFLYSVFVGEQIEVGNSVDSSPHNALVTGGRHRYEYMQHNHEFVLFEIALFLENISKSKKIIITYFTYVRLTKRTFTFNIHFSYQCLTSSLGYAAILNLFSFLHFTVFQCSLSFFHFFHFHFRNTFPISESGLLTDVVQRKKEELQLNDPGLR